MKKKTKILFLYTKRCVAAARIPLDDLCSCCVADCILWWSNCLLNDDELPPPGRENTRSMSLATDSESAARERRRARKNR